MKISAWMACSCLIQGFLLRNWQEGFLITRGEKVDELNDVFAVYPVLPRVLPERLLTHPLMAAR
jgi:hypothetical protein